MADKLDEIKKSLWPYRLEVDGGEYDYDGTTIVTPCAYSDGDFDHLFEFSNADRETVDYFLSSHNDYIPWLIAEVERLRKMDAASLAFRNRVGEAVRNLDAKWDEISEGKELSG